MLIEPPRLSRAQVAVEERIASIWPFVVSRVVEFRRTLSPRERATLGLQDLLQEAWIELYQKDPKYDPSHAYVTFAKPLLRNLLANLRDKCGTVAGPKDGRRVWNRYREQAEAGTLTVQRQRTFESLTRVAAIASLDGVPGNFGPTIDDEPTVAAQDREDAGNTRSLVVSMVRKLPPVEAKVLGLLYGLWGREAVSTAAVADRLGLTTQGVANIRRRAFRRIERRLEAVGVLGPFSEN